jgi:nucleoside-diphosphate-sugar epimerase
VCVRVLVTGADGFVGSHVSSELAAAGHEVIGTTFVRAPGENELRLDLTAPHSLASLPKVDVVVHAAGVVDAGAGVHQMRRVNVDGTRHLVTWARDQRVSHFVHLSSVAVYGPLTMGEGRGEQTARMGERLGVPYMRTKAAAERVVENGRVPYSILRPPAVVGRGDTVISRAAVAAIQAGAVPLVSGARLSREVSLVSAAGLAVMVRKTIAAGPLWTAVHATGPSRPLSGVLEAYADALGLPLQFRRFSWPEVLLRGADSGFLWLVVSGRFGQSYQQGVGGRVFGSAPDISLDLAITEAVSGLQRQGARIS